MQDVSRKKFLTPYPLPLTPARGYTLIELVVAVGLFAIVMTLASGAYLLMIGLNRQTQGITNGIDNLAFALEVMTRNIRTGSAYDCGGLGDCTAGGSFSFTDANGAAITYARGTQQGVGVIVENGTTVLTDPSVNITSLSFYVSGTGAPPGDYRQPRVTMIVTGTVSYGAGKSETFSIETGATMRGSDI